MAEIPEYMLTVTKHYQSFSKNEREIWDYLDRCLINNRLMQLIH